MGKVFVVASSEPDPLELEDVEPYADVPWQGEYFFLYPEILRLQEATGQLIDPQKNAYFAGPELDALETFLLACRARAIGQPPFWEQRVGKEWPSGDAIYRRAKQAEVLAFLDRVLVAVRVARDGHKGVLVLGE